MEFGPNWELDMLYTKSLQILYSKNISMLIGLKMSSLACKCVFYRLERIVKGRPYGIEFWVFWNAKMKYTNGMKSKSRREKWDHLSSYHVHS